MQAIGRKHALQMSSTNSTSTKRNRWWTQPVRRGPDIWHRLRVGYEIMVFMIGYSFSQNKDRGVAPVNDDVWRQKKAMVSTDDTGALRPDKRPRWKRRRINPMGQAIPCASRRLQKWRAVATRDIASQGVKSKEVELNDGRLRKTRAQNRARKTVAICRPHDNFM